MHITPTNSKAHDDLEKRAIEYLRHEGFWVPPALTYHTQFPVAVVNKLQKTDTPGGWYLRTRADRIAIHKTKDLIFEWEVKTHIREDKHDMCIEAFPLTVHVWNFKLLGVQCLYLHHDITDGHECGFWVSENIPIRGILIPERWNSQDPDYFIRIFQQVFPGLRISLCGQVRGSNDPFVIIDQSDRDLMPHWQDLIHELVL